jgi:hypothetical protein
MFSASQHADHGKRGRITPAAFVASMALIAQTLCACSGLSSSSRYLDLNEPPPRRDPGADQEAARAKADLNATRDAAQQQAFH